MSERLHARLSRECSVGSRTRAATALAAASTVARLNDLGEVVNFGTIRTVKKSHAYAAKTQVGNQRRTNTEAADALDRAPFRGGRLRVRVGTALIGGSCRQAP